MLLPLQQQTPRTPNLILAACIPKNVIGAISTGIKMKTFGAPIKVLLKAKPIQRSLVL